MSNFACRSADGLQIALGAFLLVKPHLFGFAGNEMEQIILQWTSWVAGGIAIATGVHGFNDARAASSWSLLGGAAIIAAVLVPGVFATPVLLWGLIALGAYMLAAHGLFTAMQKRRAEL